MQPYMPKLVGLLLAVVARGVIGALWYSPLLFVKPWMKAVGLTEKKMKAGMAKALSVDILASLVLAFVLAHAIHYAGAQGTAQGMVVGFFNWLGFMLVLGLGNVFFERKALKAFYIDSGYQLVYMLAMGAILVNFP